MSQPQLTTKSKVVPLDTITDVVPQVNGKATARAAITPFSLSVITASAGNATKRMIADDAGKPVKDTKHELGIWRGDVRHIEVNGLAGLAKLIQSIKPNQVFVHGVPTIGDVGDCFELLTDREYKKQKRPGTVARTKNCFDYPPGPRLIMFDVDPDPQSPTAVDHATELLSIIANVQPELNGAGWLATVSTSSALRCKDSGDWLKPPAGMHVYLLVTGDVDRFRDILKARLWLSGHGFCKLSTPNKQTGVAAVLERSLIDVTVFSPERLDYVAGALIDDDAVFYQDRPAPKLHDGAVINLDAIPALTDDEQARYQKQVESAKRKLQPKRRAMVARRVKTDQPKLSDTAIKREVKTRLERAERGELTHDHHLFFNDGKTITAGVLGEQHDHQALRDPLEPDYKPSVALFYWNEGKTPRIHSLAHGVSKTYRILKPVSALTDAVRAIAKKAHSELDADADLQTLADENDTTLTALRSEYRRQRKAIEREQQAKRAADAYDQQLKAFQSQDHSPDDVLQLLNDKHAVIQYANRVLVMTRTIDPAMNRKSTAFSSASDMRLKYLNKVVMVPKPGGGYEQVKWMDWWLTHAKRREYEGIVFDPRSTAPGYLNLWQGFAVEPAPGTCDQYKQHLLEVICAGHQAKFNYLWRWMAHLFQRTDELPETAVVLRSRQGTGKDSAANAIGKLLGRHYVPLTQTGLLVGRFSAHLMDAVLIYANEAVWGGDKQGEGKLKAMITDGLETVEAKGKDAIQFPNYKRIIAASNETWAVPRGIDDRRFFCLDVSDHRIGDDDYFTALHAEMSDAGFSAALLHELLNVDLTGWHPRRSMPKDNIDGEDLKLQSMSSPLQFLREALELAEIKQADQSIAWPDHVGLTVRKSDFYEAYLEWCNHLRVGHPQQLNFFVKEVRKAIEAIPSQPRIQGTGKREPTLQMPLLSDARKQFCNNIANVPFDDEPTLGRI